MGQESIIDTSRPNAGRIYDYLLGGSHNFEVDRQAAEQLVKLVPFLPQGMRMQRWSLQSLAIELTERRGFDILIDIASGLPTNDHVHHVSPPNTKIVYSDYDPVVVEYSKEIIAGVPNTIFLQSDARNIEDLLQDPRVTDMIRDRRDVAFITWGLSAFLSDDDIAHIARTLYDWSAPNSVWAFNAQAANGNVNDPAVAKLLAIYKQMGSTFTIRPLERYLELLHPWKPETGFIPLLEWHGFDQSLMTPEDLAGAGPGGGGYGAYLVK